MPGAQADGVVAPAGGGPAKIAEHTCDYHVTFRKAGYSDIHEKFKPADTMETLLAAVREPMDAYHRSSGGAGEMVQFAFNGFAYEHGRCDDRGRSDRFFPSNCNQIFGNEYSPVIEVSQVEYHDSH